MMTNDQLYQRIGVIRYNLREEIRGLQTRDKELHELQRAIKANQAEALEREYEQEDRRDTVKQSQALWGK